MTGKNLHVVAERQDLVEERIHQLLSRRAGQISASNRTGKQTVAHKDFHFLRLEQNHVAGSVTRAMNDCESELA